MLCPMPMYNLNSKKQLNSKIFNLKLKINDKPKSKIVISLSNN